MPRLLVVDAERFFREAIQQSLGAAGIACETAESAEQGLERARDPEIGAVVLDIRLPGMGGIGLLRKLRNERPGLRVLVLSTHTDQEDVLEALRLGACDYLAKPLHDEELVLAVRRALDAHKLERSWHQLRARLRTLEARMADFDGLAGDGDAAELGFAIGSWAAGTAADLLGASKTSLMLLDDRGDRLRVVAATGRKLAPEEMDPVGIGEGIAGLALSSGEAIAVVDVDDDARLAGRVRSDRYRSGSLAVTPVVAGGRAHGVLCATDREDGSAFGEDDLRLLQILARHVGQLLLRAAPTAPPPQPGVTSLADDGLDSDAELARGICDVLSVEIEPSRVIESVLRPIAQGLPASPVSIYLVDALSGELVLEGQWDEFGASERLALPPGRGLTGLVLETGRLVASDDPASDPRFDPEVDTPDGGRARPLLCVPIRLRGAVLGVARAFPAQPARASARTGEVLAAALSAAVRNVLLYRSLLESIDDVARARREASGRA